MPHERRHLGDVALGAGRLVAEDELLRGPAAERHLDPRLELGARVVEAVDVGRGQRHAERLAARHDRDLAHRVGARGEHPDERMAGLVVRGAAAVGRRQHDLALGAEEDLLERLGEVGSG